MENLKYFRSVYILALLIGMSSCGAAPGPAYTLALAGMNGSTAGPGNDPKDTTFLVRATQINLEEIRLGEVAKEKSKLEDVRELGKMMAVQHTKLLEDLTGLALRKNIAIPIYLDELGTADYELLNHMSGDSLDRQFVKMMITGHKAAIALFEKESKAAIDPDIRQWAAGVLPGLRMHLSHAIACQDKLKNTAAK